MFEQILHHTYKLQGEAVDVSRSGNDGRRTDTSYVGDGRSSGTGALRFTDPSSTVTVPTNETWENPRALKIEMWVKIDELGQRRNLIEGDRAFAFFVHPDGTLLGTILAPPSAGADPTWHGANSNDDSPDGTHHTVPVDEWVKLSYVHDGVSSLELYIDGQLVAANYDMYSGVPSVREKGVEIGHWVGDGRYTLDGLIDDVKVWKYDQEAALEQFFCRPMDSEQLECWKGIFDSMAGGLDDRERSGDLLGTMDCVWSEVESLVRDVRSQGREVQAQNDEFALRYRDLWCCGAIGGPAMEHLLEQWFAWMADVVGEERIREFQRSVTACYREFGVDQWLEGAAGRRLAECDPEFVDYLRVVQDTFGAPESDRDGDLSDVFPDGVPGGLGDVPRDVGDLPGDLPGVFDDQPDDQDDRSRGTDDDN